MYSGHCIYFDLLYDRGIIKKGRELIYFIFCSSNFVIFCNFDLSLYFPFFFSDYLLIDPGSGLNHLSFSNFLFIFFGNVIRYKRLLCTVDLSKDFFFSYSYHIMHSLQSNLSNGVEGHTYYESMFVWNDYLTRRIRNNAKDCMWTVALVYGFFKQVLTWS